MRIHSVLASLIGGCFASGVTFGAGLGRHYEPPEPKPAPVIYEQPSFLMVNDGFIKVMTTGFNGPVMLVCPRGVATSLVAGRIACMKGGEVGDPPVTGQGALDLAFGKGVVRMVGIAPANDGRANAVIVFYRIAAR